MTFAAKVPVVVVMRWLPSEFACFADTRVPSGPATRYTSIAMNPKLRRPSTSRTMNQVLSSSREVLSTAPIQATNWASAPPMTARTPMVASPAIDQVNADGIVLRRSRRRVLEHRLSVKVGSTIPHMPMGNSSSRHWSKTPESGRPVCPDRLRTRRSRSMSGWPETAPAEWSCLAADQPQHSHQPASTPSRCNRQMARWSSTRWDDAEPVGAGGSDP